MGGADGGGGHGGGDGGGGDGAGTSETFTYIAQMSRHKLLATCSAAASISRGGGATGGGSLGGLGGGGGGGIGGVTAATETLNASVPTPSEAPTLLATIAADEALAKLPALCGPGEYVGVCVVVSTITVVGVCTLTASVLTLADARAPSSVDDERGAAEAEVALPSA
jgi:hypothetical protein